MQWITCPSCQRHIRTHASACPFCGIKTAPVLAPVPAALACAVLGLVLGACVDRKAGDETGPTTMDEPSGGSSTSGDDESSSTSPASATSVAAVTYAAPSPDPEELAAQQGTASDTDGDATSDGE